ncbi:MAG: MmgE/PrpD family protein [Rhodobacteraceae bacterium]|nr:MmgE/PrpD family protein [Paracoccaceae bacterium]
MSSHPNADILSSHVATTLDRPLPDDILDAARMCLADWIGVLVGAHNQGAGNVARKVATAWAAPGKAPVFQDGFQSPMASALVNGTFAHCLDYDDTHLGCLAHLSGPTWAATLAMAQELGSSDVDALKAFVTGFETGARLGGKDFGETVNKRGFHSTSVIGRFSAAASASVLMGLDQTRIANAIGVAATTAGGLVASFGTMSKPFHAGKAAMDGLLAAQMGAAGFESGQALIETDGDTLANAFVQNGEARIPALDFNDGWEILNNTFKPYAACLLVHPTVESARDIHAQIGNRRVRSAQARIHPMVLRFAAKTAVNEPLEGKFSVGYCAALGLCGFDASEQDFTSERVADPNVQAMFNKVKVITDDSLTSTAATMSVIFEDDSTITADTPLARGNPGNPIGWDGMQRKFMSLAEPVYGSRANDLFDLARTAGSGDALQQISAMLAERTAD